MPKAAGEPEPMIGTGDATRAVGAPPAATARPGWLRRATLLGSAAALVGVTALAGLGTAVPNVSKGVQDGYVTAELLSQLEAVPGQALPAAGMAVISRIDSQLKAASNAFAGSQSATEAGQGGQGGQRERGEGPACVALPMASGSYRISSAYGYRIHPISGIYSLHTGVDYAAPLGTPIYAVTDGTVVYTGAGRAGRSSELVIIEHTVDDTTFYTWYVHMYPEGVFVTPGQEVRAGEVIAEVGNNGNSTGPHLHFEIHTSDPGLGNRKNPVARTSSSMVMSVVPPWSEWDVDEDTQGRIHPGTGEIWLLDPETGEPVPPSATPDPTTPPETPDPTTPPSETPDPTTPPPTQTPDPTTPPPTHTPDPTVPPTQTPDPTTPPTTGEPTDRPTDPVTGEPTDRPTDPATGEPTETPTDPATGQPVTPTPGPTVTPPPAAGAYTPFPVAAYGTTVDPARFLASLGIIMVDPRECAAP